MAKQLPVVQYGMIDILYSIFEKKRKALKEGLLPSCSTIKPLRGQNWVLTYTETPHKKLDTDAIEAKMGKGWLDQFRVDCAEPKKAIKSVEITGTDRAARMVDLTPELCDDIFKMILKHTAIQTNTKRKEAAKRGK